MQVCWWPLEEENHLQRHIFEALRTERYKLQLKDTANELLRLKSQELLKAQDCEIPCNDLSQKDILFQSLVLKGWELNFSLQLPDVTQVVTPPQAPLHERWPAIYLIVYVKVIDQI